jgi:hypothetical protein
MKNLLLTLTASANAITANAKDTAGTETGTAKNAVTTMVNAALGTSVAAETVAS